MLSLSSTVAAKLKSVVAVNFIFATIEMEPFDDPPFRTDLELRFAPQDDATRRCRFQGNGGLYTGTFSLQLDAAGDIVVTQTLVGGTVNESFTSDPLAVADDLTDGEVGVNTLTFDFLGFSVTGDAFGSVNNVDDDPLAPLDNGLSFNNVSVTFTQAIPEPGSAAILLSGLASLGLIRRRK